MKIGSIFLSFSREVQVPIFNLHNGDIKDINFK